MVETITCPCCDGRGSNAGFICYADGSGTRSQYDEAITCDLCKGVGKIAKQIAQWLEIGRAHYLNRVARDESVMECAKRLGLRPSQVSAMEHGRADPKGLDP